MEKKPLIIIAGPTAAGKTKYSIEFAKRHKGSVISADSMQVYRGMDIGSAKITREEMQGIPHYMVDILEPDERTLIIMPGSVFDVHGHRIGYGGGYYDKYLARHTQCRTIAVCFDFQIVEELPAEDHDICPELIVSEKRCIRAEG